MGMVLAKVLPPVEELGPKMQALKDDRWRLFVWHYANNGGNITRASVDAGFGDPDKTHDEQKRVGYSSGYRLLQRQDILDALYETTWKNMHQAAAPATRALINLVNDSTHKDHAKAIEMVLARTGFMAQTKHTVDVNHSSSQSDKAIEELITKLAVKHGLDPKPLLGISSPTAARVVDAAFEMVDGADGLEDIL